VGSHLAGVFSILFPVGAWGFPCIGLEEGIECRFGVKSGVEGYCQDGVMLILRITYPADDLAYPVLVDEREEVTVVFFIEYLGDMVSGNSCFPGEVVYCHVTVKVGLLLVH